jgi:hypothetical protein
MRINDTYKYDNLNIILNILEEILYPLVKGKSLLFNIICEKEKKIFKYSNLN